MTTSAGLSGAVTVTNGRVLFRHLQLRGGNPASHGKQSHRRDQPLAGHSSIQDSDPGSSLSRASRDHVRGNDKRRDAHPTGDCFVHAPSRLHHRSARQFTSSKAHWYNQGKSVQQLKNGRKGLARPSPPRSPNLLHAVYGTSGALSYTPERETVSQ
jgi:hypothetical protein